jgi:dolichol-phosphate mannosyltransferase
MARKKLSVVTPAFNESENLPVFYARLSKVNFDLDWEWIIVDDHSKDNTFAVAADLAERDIRVKAFRLSRNSGPHTAVFCGVEQASGDVCAVMATDLQDPPEQLPLLLAKWTSGAQIVWAVRAVRHGETFMKLLSSRIYNYVMKEVMGANIPAAGADFVVFDRIVAESLLKFREQNSSVLALLIWMGFKQEFVSYDKEARLHGKSGFTLRKSLKLFKDSIMSFTAMPIRVMSYIGFAIAIIGGLYALLVVLAAMFFGKPIMGWASLMTVILILGGFQLVMLGIIGEYLWTALTEVRRRPKFLLEAQTVNTVRASVSEREVERHFLPQFQEFETGEENVSTCKMLDRSALISQNTPY